MKYCDHTRARKGRPPGEAERLIRAAMIKKGIGVEDLGKIWHISTAGAWRRVRCPERMKICDLNELADLLRLDGSERHELVEACR